MNVIQPHFVSASTANVNLPAANAAAVLTISAVAAKRHYLCYVAWSYSAAPTGGKLTVEDGSGSTVFEVDVTAAGPGALQFLQPLQGSINTAMVITLAAGGVGITGKLNAYYRTGDSLFI